MGSGYYSDWQHDVQRHGLWDVMSKKIPQSAGFEPARAEPKGPSINYVRI